MADLIRQEHGLSIRKACMALMLCRTVYGYQPKPRDDETIITVLITLAERYPRYGFGKLFGSSAGRVRVEPQAGPPDLLFVETEFAQEREEAFALAEP